MSMMFFILLYHSLICHDIDIDARRWYSWKMDALLLDTTSIILIFFSILSSVTINENHAISNPLRLDPLGLFAMRF